MIKRFIVLTFFFAAGMALGLAASSFLARSQRTPHAVPAHAPDERESWPSRINQGSAGSPARQPRRAASQPSDPIGIEASHRFVFSPVILRQAQDDRSETGSRRFDSVRPATSAEGFGGPTKHETRSREPFDSVRAEPVEARSSLRTMFVEGRTGQGSAERGSQLAGAWRLNRDLSDDPRANPAPSSGGRQPGRRGGGGGFGGGFGGFGGRRGGGSGGGGQGGFDPGRMEAMQEVLQRFMEAPKKLTIVEREGEIVITDDNGRTEDLKADGRKVQQKMANGLVSATRKTEWNGATLVTEIEIENGPTIVQTYARSEGGSQLVVTTKMNAPRGGQPREIKYVYDPADSSLL